MQPKNIDSLDLRAVTARDAHLSCNAKQWISIMSLPRPMVPVHKHDFRKSADSRQSREALRSCEVILRIISVRCDPLAWRLQTAETPGVFVQIETWNTLTDPAQFPGYLRNPLMNCLGSRLSFASRTWSSAGALSHRGEALTRLMRSGCVGERS
jgi:hypothetical protein